jgi:DNA-binding CsgD family transcriptional regulator
MAHRQYKDPAELTPYEAKLYGLFSKGMTAAEIAAFVGGSSTPVTIYKKLLLAREKLELKEIIYAQDRRLSWP